ncbi:MAG: hypothetical protein V9E88_17730 [Ferruginibacter sp.]
MRLPNLKVDSNLVKLDSLKADTIIAARNANAFQSVSQTEQLSVLENDVMKVTFSSKGAQPKLVELKKFKRHDGKPVIILDGAFNRFTYTVNAATNKTAETDKLFFDAAAVQTNAR